MGVFSDLGRLMKAGFRQSMETDYAENLRLSADLAEQFVGQRPDQPTGTHGAATPNPLTNMAKYGQMIRGSGTVLTVTPTEKVIADTPVYEVRMEIVLPGRAPYPTVYRTVIAQAALPGWQPGAMFPVRVGPEDLHSVMLG